MQAKTIENIIQSMSIEEKIGQLLMIGFFGREPSPEVKHMLINRKVGSIILFSRNLGSLEEVLRMTQQLQEYGREGGQKLPLIVATDQEGGVVTRLYEGTVSPGNMAIAATGDPNTAFEVAKTMAQEMLASGINMTLGPVVDVNFHVQNPSLGVRCFSNDHVITAEYGKKAVEGFQHEGLIATVKHFPGIGSAQADSHLALSTVEKSKEQLWEEDLYPFRVALKANPKAIMLGHVHFTSYNPEEVLASSLSAPIVTGLLREKLGYDGLVVTDDLNMRAVSSTLSPGMIAELALLAGADLLPMSHYYDKQNAILDHLLEAVQMGRISEERINQSVRRILGVKIGIDPNPSLTSLDMKNNHLKFLEVARKAITHWSRSPKHEPFDPKRPITIISPTLTDLCKVEEDVHHMRHLGHILAKQGVRTQVLEYSVEPSSKEVKLVNTAVSKAEQAVICTYNMHLFPRQQKLFTNLELKAPRHKVVAIRNPYDLEILKNLYPNIDLYASYGFAPVLLEALADILVGKRNAVGSFPGLIQM